MIHTAIDHIIREINDYLNIRLGESDRLIQASLLQQDGQLSPGIDQKVLMSLVNIEEDRISRSVDINQRQPDGSFHKVKPEIKLNLYLLFVANIPNDYNEALKFISFIISFFQRKNYFDHSNSAGLDPKIERLVFELYSLTLEQQNHLWGALGAKYMPSVLFKMRIVAIQEDEIDGTTIPIREIDIQGKDKWS